MKYSRVLWASLLLAAGLQLPAFAHVKWFSSYSFLHKPLTIGDIVSPLFWGLLVLSLVVISVFVFVDEDLANRNWYKGLCVKISRYATKSDTIIRVAVGAVLILSWQSGALLVPELVVNSPWAEFFQLGLAALILSNRLTTYAGMGLMGLYLITFFMYSWIHMLDYMYIMGAGYYLMVQHGENKKLKDTGLMGLYASVGFSLCWVSMEKLFYPGWGIEILEGNPQLALGMDFSFFLFSSAFVEFSLGFLLIMCMLQRPIAFIITIVFMCTTLVFGKTEFVGHAIVHAALIVFFLRGAGKTFRTPVTFFKRMSQRLVFANVSFAILFALIFVIYSGSSMHQFEIVQAQRSQDPHEMVIQLASATDNPKLDIEIIEGEHGGWNLHLLTQNFQFSPADEGKSHVEGFGHAHLYIDKQKAARLYGPWYHIKDLPPGKHEITVTLTANNHNEYVINNIPVAAKRTLLVD